MQVRLRHLRRLRRDEYRMTLDLIDSERGPWDQGDCVVQIDLLDAPGQHASSARGLFKPALELYRLMPSEPPTTAESRLLWDIGEAVHCCPGPSPSPSGRLRPGSHGAEALAMIYRRRYPRHFGPMIATEPAQRVTPRSLGGRPPVDPEPKECRQKPCARLW